MRRSSGMVKKSKTGHFKRATFACMIHSIHEFIKLFAIMYSLHNDNKKHQKERQNMNTKNKTLKIVLAGLLAALTCVATMIIRIPTFKGYVHIGDCMVIASGIILGPVVGGLAAGIGSMLADILGGYFVFSVATLIIKFLAAFAAGISFSLFKKVVKKYDLPSVIVAGIASEVVVVLGYFIFEIFYEGMAAAIAEILPNCVQGVTGLILAAVLSPILLKIPMIRNVKFQIKETNKANS